MTPALTCQACNTAKPEAKVRWRSFDMDLPAVRLCQYCSVLLVTDPDLLEEARRVL